MAQMYKLYGSKKLTYTKEAHSKISNYDKCFHI